MNKVTKVIINKNYVKKEFYNTFYFSKSMYINELSKYKYLEKYSFLNIPKVLNNYINSIKNVIILEKIEAITLAEYLYSKELLEKLKIFKKILNEVKKLHEVYLVHNDLNLQNILIDATNQVYIIDFSVSFCVNQKSKLVTVTIGYSPIEKYSKEYISDYKTDIYSLTSILYYILFNIKPKDSIKRFHNNDILLFKNKKISDFFLRAYSINMDYRISNMNEYIKEYEKIERLILKDYELL